MTVIDIATWYTQNIIINGQKKQGQLTKVKFIYKGPDINAVLDKLPAPTYEKLEDGSYRVQTEIYGSKGIEMWLGSQNEWIDRGSELLHSSPPLMDSISFLDSKEAFYHGFLLGILGNMHDFLVKSSRESGQGRYDAWLLAEGYTQVHFYGIAFFKKQCRVKLHRKSLCRLILINDIKP